MDEKSLLDRIERNSNIMFGKPVIRGTRLPVDLILEKLAYNDRMNLFTEYPFLKEEDLDAALLYASKMVSLEEVVST